jgi:hypothetical protein
MNHVEVVSLLISHGADVKIRGKQGSALDLALRSSEPHPQLISLLKGSPIGNKHSPLLNGHQDPDYKNSSPAPNSKDPKEKFFKSLLAKKENSYNIAKGISFEDGMANSSWIIDDEELEIQTEIGSGRFGRVYKGLYRGQTVAIKGTPVTCHMS